jgi:hypothetical protein
VEAQATFSDLWKQAPNGRLLANYYGIVHPSQVRHSQPPSLPISLVNVFGC